MMVCIILSEGNQQEECERREAETGWRGKDFGKRGYEINLGFPLLDFIIIKLIIILTGSNP